MNTEEKVVPIETYGERDLVDSLFALGNVSPVVSIPTTELDDSLIRDIRFGSGQAAKYVIEERPVFETNYSLPTGLIGNARGVHHLRLNMLVHNEGDEAHIYPDQSRVFNGLVDTSGEVYRIASVQSVKGLTMIRRMEKLDAATAREIVITAIKLKRYLLAKAQGE